MVLAYVAVVGLTFAGVQLADTLAPPGIADLSEPAGESPGIGPDAQESPLPPGAFDPDADPAAPAPGPGAAAGQDTSTTPTTETPTTAPTTTTAPGGGTTTTIPTTNSTVPDHTRPTAPDGPPDEPPGKP